MPPPAWRPRGRILSSTPPSRERKPAAPASSIPRRRRQESSHAGQSRSSSPPAFSLTPLQLVVITGLPTSGKTTRARQLHAYLAERIALSSTSTLAAPSPSPSEPPTHTTSAAAAAAPALNPKSLRLHYISDATLSIPRSVYDLSPDRLPAHVRSANSSEKDARAAVYAAAKRVLSDRDVVILDGPNYIKGWRYQLYCEARTARTPSVVVQVGCAVERARAVNEERLRRRDAAARGEKNGDAAEPPVTDAGDAEGVPDDRNEDDQITLGDDEDPYEPSNWENLVFRYEEPNPMNRWDSPLFTLIWDDDEATAKQTFEAIWDAIAGSTRKVAKPHQATIQRGGERDRGGDYLYVLDRETQDIVKRILERQAEDGGGGEGAEVALPGGGGDGSGELVVRLPGVKVGLPQLQRMRRAFVAMSRGGIGLEAAGVLAVERIRTSFVGYLNVAFENDE